MSSARLPACSAVFLFVFLLSAAPVHAVKQAAPADLRLEPLSADAVALGAKFGEAAPAKLRRWCAGKARSKELQKQPTLQTAAELVEKSYREATGEARGAATFLLIYIFYLEEMQREAELTARLRDGQPPLVNAEEHGPALNVRTPDTRLSSPASPSTLDRSRQLEELRFAEERSGRDRVDRQRLLTELALVRARIGAALRILAATEPRARLLRPDVLNEFR